MRSLEDRLRPPTVARPWGRDLFCVGLLLGLGLVLVLPLEIDWSAAAGAGEASEDSAYCQVHLDRVLRNVTGQMVSIYLLMAMGFLLCLRCGAIDLSVWVAAGVGGVVAAKFINAGTPAGPALAAGALAGAMLGGINGLLVAGTRVPSVVATLVTGLAAMWVLQAAVPARVVPPGVSVRVVSIPDDTFSGWHIMAGDAAEGQTSGAPNGSQDSAAEQVSPEQRATPLYLTRMLLVTGIYAVVMLAMTSAGWTGAGPTRFGARRVLFAALCASGALSAAGGALWLLDQNQAPAPARLIGDLRVPTAAILAGGILLAGKGRALLAGICLPGALLVTTLWRQGVWHLPAGGYLLQVGVLLGMTIVAYAAAAELCKARRTGRWPAALGAALTLGGILTVAVAAARNTSSARTAFRAAGIAAWVAGAALLVTARVLRARRQPVTGPPIPAANAAGDADSTPAVCQRQNTAP